MIIFFAVLVVLSILFCLAIKAVPNKQVNIEKFRLYDYAHRGLYDNKTVPENSLTAFQKAINHGFGMELDLQLSNDGQVVVFHDDTLKRMCGIDKKVNELTYSQLEKLSLLETNEKIPLFSEVLKVVDKKAPIIVELKSTKQIDELCQKTCTLLERYGGVFCVESFSSSIVRWFRRNRPEYIRGQLSCSYKNAAHVKLHRKIILKNLLLNFCGKPQFIAYDHRMNSLGFWVCRQLYHPITVAWTVRNQEEYEAAKNRYDLIIFESFYPNTIQ